MIKLIFGVFPVAIVASYLLLRGIKGLATLYKKEGIAGIGAGLITGIIIIWLIWAMTATFDFVFNLLYYWKPLT